MKNLRIYEQYLEDTPVESQEKFKIESNDFKPTELNDTGNYIVTFKNVEGQDTTMEIGAANNPKFKGDKMSSTIDMVPETASDNGEYSIVGYYEAVPDSTEEYKLISLSIEEA